MRRTTGFAALLFLGAWALGCASFGGVPPAQLETRRIADLESSVFEVVVKKHDESHVRYAGRERLPIEELPYAERTDPYFGVGTAFALAGGRIVSAAHVFQLDRMAIDRSYFLRDRSGRVYPITAVTRYSQVRDLIELSLPRLPEGLAPLKTRTRTMLGETVYTVGNAEGEGIAVRSGQIASYTFEPVSGAWKDIRFSAPASPGNSGGPLVNTRGEVVGVVVRKNESENLNVAVPIAELQKLSSRTAEFFVASIEANSDYEPVRDWRFKAPLPASLKTLGKAAEADRRRFHLSQWRKARGRTKELAFPYDAALFDYYASQTYAPHVQILSWDDKAGFEIKPDEAEWTKTTSKGEVVTGLVSEDVFSLAQIELPEGVRHADYVREPERLLEAFFETFGFFREFNGRKIALASYGAPAERGVYVDALGRPWVKAIWRTHYNQASFILNCLPAVTGFGCALDNIETADETTGLQEKFEAYYAAKITMSYGGSVAQWRRFLSLGNRLVPEALRNLALGPSGGRVVRFAGGDFKLDYPQPLYSDRSQLFVGVGYGLKSPLRPEIHAVRFEHGDDLAVSESFEASLESVDVAVEVTAPRRVLSRRAIGGGRRVVQTVSCRGPSCATIENALKSRKEKGAVAH